MPDSFQKAIESRLTKKPKANYSKKSDGTDKDSDRRKVSFRMTSPEDRIKRIGGGGDIDNLASIKSVAKNYSGSRKPLSKSEITELQSENETAGVATRPSDYMAPYYGSEEILAKEAKKAADYRLSLEKERNKKFFSVSPESRMFDTVSVETEPRLPASYSPVDKKVEVYGREGGEIRARNAETLARFLSGSDPKLREEAEKLVYGNEYASPSEYGGKDPVSSASSAVEHELGHHVYRPENEIDSNPPKESYFNRNTELYQGLSRLQREVFQNTGKRFEQPEDLYNVIKSGKVPEYLSPEGRRVINYLQKQIGGDDEYVKEVSKMAPMFVENDKNKDFLSSVEARMS